MQLEVRICPKCGRQMDLGESYCNEGPQCQQELARTLVLRIKPPITAGNGYGYSNVIVTVTPKKKHSRFGGVYGTRKDAVPFEGDVQLEEEDIRHTPREERTSTPSRGNRPAKKRRKRGSA